MCGIVGLASTSGNVGANRRKEVLAELLMWDTVRGWDSTGLACVQRGGEKKTPLVFKRAVNGFDFIQLKGAHRILNDTDRYALMIGHNRAATRGSVYDHNAHPFQYDHITLVHNGTITNHKALGVEADEEVDSAAVAAAFAHVGVKETLEKVWGGFCFVWHDAEDGTLNIARNDQKPMHWIYEKGENTMYFASELEMLWAALVRNGVKPDGKFNIPTPGTHFKFRLNDLRSFERIPFGRAYQGGSQTNTEGKPWMQRTRTMSGTNAQQGQPSPHGDQSGTSSNKSASTASTTSASSGPARNVTESVMEEKERLLAKFPHRPTNEARKKAYDADLKRHGFYFDQVAKVVPITWNVNKNQRELGEVGGYLEKSPEVKVKVSGVPLKRYTEYSKRKGMFCRIVKVDGVSWTSETNERIVTLRCHEHERQAHLMDGAIRWEEKERAKAAAASRGSLRDDDPVHPQAEDDGPSGLQLSYRGPNGTTISRGKWDELTRRGCAYCDNACNPMYDTNMIWVGNDPICHVCAKDSQVLDYLGTRAWEEATNPEVVH